MTPTRLVLLGDPVAHSLSPTFQNAALRAAGISLTYETMRANSADLSRVASALTSENAAGNVTVPHKVAFLSLCAEVSPIASRVGAVNTFWASNGKLVGDNTDVGGFDAAVRSALGVIPDRLRVAIIGSGGAAAAVLGAAESWPRAEVRMHSRNAERASRLAARFPDVVRVESTAHDALCEAKLVINATPIGMSDDTMPFSIESLSPGATVLDLVYRRGGTALTLAASAAGFHAADGTEMLIEQGALSFERWFGFFPDRTVMRAALE